ncbi:peptidyl-tRNA hydrolase [Spizellomyces punctatus DAOM BR117]|uniref:peptidyl-tRNA hydrolase n=1 Tax=Spizellomyces punctatus (strain DAOM BR117) TaxID=645134 RepID=A0A0L0HEN5_SPIPD|nr:peptidyl-tRNA hydrolase [Spizellomyces punctatus DAOM BR117]KNC99920.1 peptidyl-tRNA hydrolase [Spizellomyces punctatus DAOM BR117]|eukprot:XP_016607960.1 peptidyl-tRNA hydrolase [Spizellomyces punctatus DAOM BR117]
MESIVDIYNTLATRHYSVLHVFSAGTFGVFVGLTVQRWWQGRRQKAPAPLSPSLASPRSYQDDSESDTDEDSDSLRAHKMVLVVRTDLGMGKGKIAAQCCHAAVAAVQTAQYKAPDVLRKWEKYGAAKVALKCSSEKELLHLHALARKAGLVAEYIEDAGRTQIPEGSRTVLAIGPAPIQAVDTVTGHLKLL